MMDELNAVGIPDANMRIVFALGTHHAMSEEEMVEAVVQVEIMAHLDLLEETTVTMDLLGGRDHMDLDK